MPGRTQSFRTRGVLEGVAVTTMSASESAASRSPDAASVTPARSMPNWSASIRGSAAVKRAAWSGVRTLTTVIFRSPGKRVPMAAI